MRIAIGWNPSKTEREPLETALTLREPQLREVDGEDFGRTREFTVTVQPSAMRVK